MYKQNFRNQAVIEVKNGSSINMSAKKFGIAPSTLNSWLNDYDEKMLEMTGGDNKQEPRIAPVNSPVSKGIELQSIKVQINGAIVTLKRNDVLKLLNLFNILDERIEG